MEPITVTEEEVLNIMQNLKLHKAVAGGITSRIAKELAAVLAPLLTHITNGTLGQPIFPKSLKMGLLLPVFKKEIQRHYRERHYRETIPRTTLPRATLPRTTLPRIPKTILPRIQRTTLPRRLVCWKSRINEASFVFCTSCLQT
ncbi:unnamed protein product [Didymodactylos carnosus]|uniref:Uncharacterized protein n=1 Tax=Didymodactylos carnosus TaxID=1234261 RepID=A0A816A2B5_9BILA|nr:unnamed protein product [Didymodactylos carnosus]CAF4464347.1 unnamed protein product [Didymodactylos carnosus]